MLSHECLPVFDSSAGEHPKEAGIIAYCSFEDLHSHANYEESHEEDRDEKYQEEDAPHCAITLHERIFLTGLVIEAEVDYEDHNEERESFKRVKLRIIEWLLLYM